MEDNQEKWHMCLRFPSDVAKEIVSQTMASGVRESATVDKALRLCWRGFWFAFEDEPEANYAKLIELIGQNGFDIKLSLSICQESG